MTELHYAAYSGDLEFLINCLESGMPVDSVDTYRSYSALHWLCDMAATGGPRLEMLDKLLEFDADINLKSNDGRTPLSLAKDSTCPLGDQLAEKLKLLGALES